MNVCACYPGSATLATLALPRLLAALFESLTRTAALPMLSLPLSLYSVRELPSEKRSPEQPELVVRSPRAHCSYRKKRAKVNPRMVFFPKWVSKQVTDRQNPCQVAEATHGVHMEGGMLHANESQEVDALRTPEVGLEGMESVLLSLGVSRVLAREAASLHPNDINDWACSSLRRHRRPATADVINVDELPSSASLSGPPIPVSWLPSTGEPFAAESLPPHSLPASSSAARSMDPATASTLALVPLPAPPLAQSFAAPGVLPDSLPAPSSRSQCIHPGLGASSCLTFAEAGGSAMLSPGQNEDAEPG